MGVKIEFKNETLISYLEGEIDHHTARRIRREIDLAIEKYMPALLILDFFDVTFMDSSGIGLVMGRYKILQKSKSELFITNTSDSIYKVMKLAGLEKIAKINKGCVK